MNRLNCSPSYSTRSFDFDKFELRLSLTGRRCGDGRQPRVLLLLAAAAAAAVASYQADGVQEDPAARLDGVTEIGVEPAVNERIVADGRHGQPVTDEESRRVVSRRTS